MNRFIQFGSKITLNYKPLRGLGVREMLLLGLAACQGVYLIFLAESINFALRLTIAVFLAVLLLAIATVPVRGYKVEYFLFGVLLRGLIRPRRYLHQTATRRMPFADGMDSVADTSAADDVDHAVSIPRPARTGVGWDEWAGPDIAVAMAVFVAILLAGSLIAYVSHAGGPPWR